jgi:hypothetical protein
MTDKYFEGGSQIEREIAATRDRLVGMGATGTPVLFMRERLFKTLAGTIKMDFNPPCLIIHGEPIAVTFDESIEERIETEGVMEYSSDIVMRFYLEGEEEWESMKTEEWEAKRFYLEDSDD